MDSLSPEYTWILTCDETVKVTIQIFWIWSSVCNLCRCYIHNVCVPLNSYTEPLAFKVTVFEELSVSLHHVRTQWRANCLQARTEVLNRPQQDWHQALPPSCCRLALQRVDHLGQMKLFAYNLSVTNSYKFFNKDIYYINGVQFASAF